MGVEDEWCYVWTLAVGSAVEADVCPEYSVYCDSGYGTIF